MTGTVLVAAKWPGELDRLAGAASLIAPGARMRIVHVGTGEEEGAHLLARRLLEDAVGRLRAGGLEVEGRLLAPLGGSVAARLAEQVRSFRPSLVVTGSRGLGRVAGLLQQSVSQVMPAEVDEERHMLVVPSGAPLSTRPLRRVLVAVGSDQDAGRLVNTVVRLPGHPEALLVHVPLLVAVHLARAGIPDIELPETPPELPRPAGPPLLRADRPSEPHRLTGHRHVAESIARTARLWEADLIVVGSSRPGRLASLAAGSTAHDLLSCADRPVLLTPGD